MWKNIRNAFYKTRSARNSCSKGNIDRSKSALALTDKICVKFFVLIVEKHQERKGT